MVKCGVITDGVVTIKGPVRRAAGDYINKGWLEFPINKLSVFCIKM